MGCNYSSGALERFSCQMSNNKSRRGVWCLSRDGNCGGGDDACCHGWHVGFPWERRPLRWRRLDLLCSFWQPLYIQCVSFYFSILLSSASNVRVNMTCLHFRPSAAESTWGHEHNLGSDHVGKDAQRKNSVSKQHFLVQREAVEFTTKADSHVIIIFLSALIGIWIMFLNVGLFLKPTAGWVTAVLPPKTHRVISDSPELCVQPVSGDLVGGRVHCLSHRN